MKVTTVQIKVSVGFLPIRMSFYEKPSSFEIAITHLDNDLTTDSTNL
jgi:hypothetical protein